MATCYMSTQGRQSQSTQVETHCRCYKSTGLLLLLRCCTGPHSSYHVSALQHSPSSPRGCQQLQTCLQGKLLSKALLAWSQSATPRRSTVTVLYHIENHTVLHSTALCRAAPKLYLFTLRCPVHAQRILLFCNIHTGSSHVATGAISHMHTMSTKLTVKRQGPQKALITVQPLTFLILPAQSQHPTNTHTLMPLSYCCALQNPVAPGPHVQTASLGTGA